MALIMAMACAQEQEFEREFIDPAGGGTQVVTVSDHGVKTIYVGGQVGRGDDFAAHVDTAFQSVVRRLESAGASATDVVKIRIFVTDFDPAEYSIIREARLRTFNEDSWPTSTMVGIQSLWTEEFRVEIEAVAVIADPEVPGATVTIDRLGPSNGFSQSVVVTANGIKTLYISGQVGRAGESLETQADQTYANLRRQLEAAGATPADLVQLTIYIANYQPEDAAAVPLRDVWSQIMVSGTVQRNGFPDENLPASALIGPESLYSDTALIEIEGVAVVQGGLEEQ